jgi:hypothetical protein
MRMKSSENEPLVERIRAEYLEMPGMTLRLEQVARLCGIERSICKVVLDALVAVKFLCLRPDGTYARLSSETTLRARSDKPTFQTDGSSYAHRRAS